jgi:hypothetical protein
MAVTAPYINIYFNPVLKNLNSLDSKNSRIQRTEGSRDVRVKKYKGNNVIKK